MRLSSSNIPPYRFAVTLGFFLVFFVLVLWKLFQLQIIQGVELQEKAFKMRNASISIDAHRGGIFMQDSKTNEKFPVALNTTLSKVFFDARPIISSEKDFPLVAKTLTDILYTEKRYQECVKDTTKCPPNTVIELKDEKNEVIKKISPTYDEAKLAFEKDLDARFREQKKDMIYANNVDDDILAQLANFPYPHLEIAKDARQVIVHMEGLTDTERKAISEALAKSFGGTAKDIAEKLVISRKGYIEIMDRVVPDQVDAIQKIKDQYEELYQRDLVKYQQLQKAGQKNIPEPNFSPFKGVGFQNDPIRYYPEGNLGAQVIGFLDGDRVPQYGIEKGMDKQLRGENGIISAAKDVKGNAVQIQKSNSGEVIDGANVVLTIDRTLQKKVEEELDRAVKLYSADSGQAILINPKNGEILAMGISPRFDPNFYGKVYERRPIKPEDIEFIYKTTPIEKKNENGNFVPVKYKDFEVDKETGKLDGYYWYTNRIGAGAYVNKTTMEIYEPGSVIKPLIMAAAMEEGEITPDTRYYEEKPIEVGPFTIKNVDELYKGWQTMSNIIERSANVGMGFIAQRMGTPLLYDALKKMEFGEYTNIQLPEEVAGEVDYYSKWPKSKMFTVSFGQGFSATPLQTIRAWTSLAEGYIVEPRLVKEIEYANGEKQTFTSSRKKIFSPQTVQDMRKILINTTEIGGAKLGQVDGYYIAGKTGTSQIVRVDGAGYESISSGEDGTTIGSYIGFAPVNDPQLLLLVKFDRPRASKAGTAVFGSTTAGPVFSDIMKFALEYYNIPQDKKEKK